MNDYSTDTKADTARKAFSPEKDKLKPKKPSGTFEGSVYYSEKLPKGELANIPFNREIYDSVTEALASGDKSDIGKAMIKLSEIGVYDAPIDSTDGKYWRGSANRVKLEWADDAFMEDMKSTAKDVWNYITGGERKSK